MPRSQPPTTPRPADWDPVLRSLLFWSFVCVSLLLFAACVLLPEWRETQRLVAHHEAMAERTAVLQARVEQQQREADAVRTRPVVLQRLLQRELRYVRPDEDDVVLLPPMHKALHEARLEPERPPTSAPLMPAWLEARLPGGQWVNVFHESPDRSVCLVLSGVLLVSAFWLFPPLGWTRAVRRARAPRPAA